MKLMPIACRVLLTGLFCFVAILAGPHAVMAATGGNQAVVLDSPQR